MDGAARVGNAHGEDFPHISDQLVFQFQPATVRVGGAIDVLIEGGDVEVCGKRLPVPGSRHVAHTKQAGQLLGQFVRGFRVDKLDANHIGSVDQVLQALDVPLLVVERVLGEAAAGLHLLKLGLGGVEPRPRPTQDGRAGVALDDDTDVGPVGMAPDNDRIDRGPPQLRDRLLKLFSLVRLEHSFGQRLLDLRVEQCSGVGVAGGRLGGDARIVRVQLELVKRHELNRPEMGLGHVHGWVPRKLQLKKTLATAVLAEQRFETIGKLRRDRPRLSRRQRRRQ